MEIFRILDLAWLIIGHKSCKVWESDSRNGVEHHNIVSKKAEFMLIVISGPEMSGWRYIQ